jgi:3-phenylpropionate/trans-cinnamate dioxygenase ferredoxin component
MVNWVEACDADDIEEEDVMRFDYAGRTFALYRSPDDEYFATDGICTHEHAYLTDGRVMDNIIECGSVHLNHGGPQAHGRFDYRNRRSKGRSGVCQSQNLHVKVEGGKVMIDVGG